LQRGDHAWVALLLCAAALYLLGLDSPFAPTNGDEMVYLHIARLTAESGHWLPLVSDLANMRNTKPPLLIWQAMVAGGWGNAWHLAALRLPSVLYTFMTTGFVVALTYRFSERLRTACLAGVIYLAFFSTFRYGRVYLTSAPETFWLALPMFWLLMRAHTQSVTISWRVVAPIGVCFGLGCAYKSFALVAPAAAALWCAVLITHPATDWRVTLDTSARLGLSTLIALGIFGLWLVFDPDPAAVWREFVLGENAAKLGSDAGYWHDALSGSSSAWVQMLAYFENAGLLWFVAMGVAWTVVRGGRLMRTGHPEIGILLVWLLVWLAVFTLPSQRSARYVIPAMPALAILAALLWQRIGRLWFWLTLLLLAPVLVMLARIGWVLNETDIGSPFWCALVWFTSALGLIAVLWGAINPAAVRNATLVACLSVYACFGAMVAPLNQSPANYSAEVQTRLKGAHVAVPNGFNAQYERFHFLLPGSALEPYDTDGRNTHALYPDLPADARLEKLLEEFDAVVWVQESAGDSQPACAPACKVLAQRWHVKSRHQSGEVTLANLWYPQQWLFRREWLLQRAAS